MDCKLALQRELKLPLEPDMPLLVFIGRLDYQKGPDLVLDALNRLVNLGCQVWEECGVGALVGTRGVEGALWGVCHCSDSLLGCNSPFAFPSWACPDIPTNCSTVLCVLWNTALAYSVTSDCIGFNKGMKR